MLAENIKMASGSLRNTKWRSLLTTFGIVIGVASVVSTVSLGIGIKQQLFGQINRLGSDIITVRPGNLVNRDAAGNITKVNTTSGYNFASGSLAQSDLDIIQKKSDLAQVAPIGVISGTAKAGNSEYTGGTIISTSQDLAAILNHKLGFGVFFSKDEDRKSVAVIGQDVAERLYGENAPIGMTISLHGQDFVIRGVFDKFTVTPLAFGPDFNKAIFIPYGVGQTITGGNTQLVQVLIKPNQFDKTKDIIVDLNYRLGKAHGGQHDFTVLRQDENLAVTSDILNLFTAFIAGIAAISLLVGGIGIMNIMLVSVSERTREIGIRKAIGATNQQILGQFVIETSILSLAGAAVGILIALLVNLLIRLLTSLEPVVSWQIMLAAAAVALVVGLIFGIAPAAKAARKDPIDALRYE